jgi:hypothetical protein
MCELASTVCFQTAKIEKDPQAKSVRMQLKKKLPTYTMSM